MNLDHLKVFVSLSETLNFSLTAKETHISQSAVSQAIKSIEEELGFKLFKRTKRKVVLTKGGAFCYPRIKNILNNFNKTVIEARDIYQTENSLLTLGTTGTPFESYILPSLIKKYRKTYPNTKIYLENFNHTLLKQHVLNQESDIIFTTQDDVSSEQKLSFITLMHGYFCALVPNSNILNNKHSIKLTDLKNQSLILLNDDWCPPKQLKLQEAIKIICPKEAILYANDVSIATTMVKANLGITFMPNFINFPDTNFFKTIPLNYTTNLAYGVATLSSPRDESLIQFINWLLKYPLSEIDTLVHS
ncbi:LysR family transcriptional regulator [Ligilactobacillus sp. WILCCON 0076]|uniref:LysR family transcriptional regulator n=1 Tax=Ligilactobacillus ubinensis TaxID=2876789 RepID=A0A9X2FQ01_9LACO|nr:LysR family transcriptional regulator [Ligilactobacillus ubinensis]MCP0887781.1 LysR family transcriptional regulator [Ligilactobacillus ubinensis]